MAAFLNDLTPEEALNLDPQTTARLDQAGKVNRQLRYEMETFFLWSSIFLSKLVQFLGSFMSHGKLRGARVGSHNKFWPTVFKNPVAFPFFSSDVIRMAEWLGINVIEYRDYFVTHTNNTENRDQYLIKAIVFQRTDPPRPVIVSFKAYESKHVESKPLEQILPTILEYTNRLLDMVESEANDAAALKASPPVELAPLFDGVDKPEPDEP